MYLPFSSDDEFFEFIRAQNYTTHVHVLLRQPFVFQTLFGGKSFPAKSFSVMVIDNRKNIYNIDNKTVLFSFDQQRAYKVLGVLRNGIERLVVEIEFSFRYIGERFGVVIAHERW